VKCGLVQRSWLAMRGPMRAGWLHSRGALRCTGCDAMSCDARDAMREPMRCELVAMQCAALRCTVRGLFAIQCAARGLVAFARCRRRHAFDGGIFRVGGEGLREVYGFSSLVKQNKKGKNCAVFCFAGKRKLLYLYLRCDYMGNFS
jgi:hypothetical protein